ncbi:MAG: hypothetical protein WC794_02115 [Candidatus Doudnabacteria bacterium]|jgi:hypothetical protein
MESSNISKPNVSLKDVSLRYLLILGWLSYVALSEAGFIFSQLRVIGVTSYPVRMIAETWPYVFFVWPFAVLSCIVALSLIKEKTWIRVTAILWYLSFISWVIFYGNPIVRGITEFIHNQAIYSTSGLIISMFFLPAKYILYMGINTYVLYYLLRRND